jgi:hypothetical protein
MDLNLKTLVVSAILAVLISPAAHAAGLLPFDLKRRDSRESPSSCR